MKIELGMKVEDVITGFRGVAMCRAEYLTGCTQYGVAPAVDKDGRPVEWVFIDEGRLKVIDVNRVLVERPVVPDVEEPPKHTGGPQVTPSRY